MRRGVIYIDKNYVEFGNIKESRDNIRILFEGHKVWGVSYEELKEHLGFNYKQGLYVIGSDVETTKFPAGREMFPYNLDSHTYNTKFAEYLFEGKQLHLENIQFNYIDELPYTFGLEFETAGGFLPQHRLYELGLIPLRDGSISGIEFSTVVLQGNLGLNLLKQQIENLNKHTIFDKDCSLHVHLGNFDLNGDVLLAVNNLFFGCGMNDFLPPLTFETHQYKTNTEKNYCEFNNPFRTFDEMYSFLVGRQFYGDLFQPHPKDMSGTRKWNIKQRYKAVNFINALCYDSPKTIEFRMLRPTYNFDKILGWLFIYGALIKYAELNSKSSKIYYRIKLPTIIKSVYSKKLADILLKFLDLLLESVSAQTMTGDHFGMRTDIEDKIINYETFGHYFY